METRPQQTPSLPGFDPEVHHLLSPESCESAGVVCRRCPKAATNHPLYIPFNDLDLQHLPTKWRHQDTLQHIRDIGQRVVKLKVLKKSPERPVDDPRLRKCGHTGTGFVAYDSDQGAPVVHTNRHVVYDPYEASNTEVIFFYEGVTEGIKCAGSSQGFRCHLVCSDQAVFSLKQPLPEAVVTWQNGPMSSCQADNQDRTQEAAARKAEKLDETFSLAGIADLTGNGVIISHPHGSRKQVSVGNLSAWNMLQYCNTAFSHNVPTCPGSSGAPLLTLRRMDNRPLMGRLNGLDIPEVTAGRIIHQGAYPSAQGTVNGIGAPRGGLTVSYDELQTDNSALCRLQQLLINTWTPSILPPWTFPLVDVFWAYGLYCVLGPPWTLAAFVFFLFYIICFVVNNGAGLGLPVLDVLHLSLRLAAMHGVTQLAYVLAPPDEQGWLRTALITLSYFLARNAMISTPFTKLLILVLSKRPRALLRVEDWLVGWAETHAPKLRRIVQQGVTGRGDEGAPFPSLIEFWVFICCGYVWFWVVGPRWTPSAFVFLLVITIIVLMGLGHQLSEAVFVALSKSLDLAAMHGVTQLTYVLAPPDDRNWLSTALVTLLLGRIYLVMNSTPVLKLKLLAWSKRPRAMIQVEDWSVSLDETLTPKLQQWVEDQIQEGPLICIIKHLSLLVVYTLYCVVGPPWTPAASVFLLVSTILRFVGVVVSGTVESGGELLYIVFALLPLIQRLAAMHGVTQLAYVLVPADDRGWLWTALLALSSLLIDHVLISTPVLKLKRLAWSKRPRVMLRVEDRLGRWVESLAVKMRRLWRMYGMGLTEE